MTKFHFVNHFLIVIILTQTFEIICQNGDQVKTNESTFGINNTCTYYSNLDVSSGILSTWDIWAGGGITLGDWEWADLGDASVYNAADATDKRRNISQFGPTLP